MPRTAQRSCPKIIQPDRYPHMRIGAADAIRRVERNPAELRHECLRPGMAGLLLVDAIAAAEITADVTRRNAEIARRRDEDVGEVLTDPALESERLRRRGGRMGRIGIVGHLRMQALEYEVEDVERIVSAFLAA